MIYNPIESKNISFGQAKAVFGKKTLTPIYYNNAELEFNERNRYVNVSNIETNTYGKKQVTIKSKYINDNINTIIDKINKELDITIRSPINSDGSIKVNVSKDTKFTDKDNKMLDVEKLSNNSFSACISIIIPTFFSDKDKHTIQLNISQCIVIGIKPSLEIDFDALKISE